MEAKSIEEPKRRLEKLIALSAFSVGYFYTYVYQNMLHIEVELIDLKTLIHMPIIALVVFPLIHYLIIKSDPLQRSPSNRKPIRFFQNEFPSKYLLKRCNQCIENENTCKNFIRPGLYAHIRYWFDNIFHGEIEKQNPRVVKSTFSKGYTCKLLYYLTWILFIFFLLAIATVLFHHAYLCFSNTLKTEITSQQVLFPFICLAIIILIRKLNNPDEKAPTGCWQAWREINGIHISWLQSNENFLVNLICHDSGGTKKFVQK